MSRLNVELLRRTQRLVVKNCRDFDAVEDEKFGIEGWLLTAAGRDVNRSRDIYNDAIKLLRVNRAQADMLFCLPYWPVELSREYRDEPITERDFKLNAALAIRRIDYFIERGS